MITPDVAKNPIYKVPKSMEEEEKKESSDVGVMGGMKRITGESVLMNAKIDEPSIIGSDSRAISGMNMALSQKKIK